MNKTLLLLISILPLSLLSQAQSVRYKDLVFTDAKITADLTYAPEQQENTKSHLFDLYEPDGDANKKRPLIIWMHGGGFSFGSKDAKGIKIWGESFAKRGYVCAGINYRLGNKFSMFSSSALKKSSYYAVQDARMAVTYFKKNAAKYNIDPDKIILAGNSAGGIIALITAYTNNAELAKNVDFKSEDKAAISLSKTRTHIAGVVNFWGGIFDLEWLKNARVPIVSVYGDKDKLVHPGNNNGFYGSLSVHNEADKLHIPNDVKVFEGYAHELQKSFNPLFAVNDETKDRWLQAGQFSADFLYKTVITHNKE